MQHPIARRLDALARWRQSLERPLAALVQALQAHELLDPADHAGLAHLHARLAGDRLVLAFVAEFSRGKSELINAIFFADAGRRVLPATPGRTTMCPVELRFDADTPPGLQLLPIETRLRGLAVAELRGRPEHWQTVPLPVDDPDALADALAAVTRTQRVPTDTARALGLWNDSQPEDNPPQDAQGLVEVPAWRHALINYPHPLLQRGLVVLDTPGLNAIGAEPELTLGLLPSAHAIVFVLAADTGVTRSDLSIWREHLAHPGLERFVVLNKIDALADPMATPLDVARQIEQQRLLSASTLDMPMARVFALSARSALAARVAQDDAALQASGVTALEAALAAELLPRQHSLLAQAASATLAQLQQAITRRLGERRRQHAEQTLELRGLRSKSGGKLRLLQARAEAESSDFERCTARLAALRAVQQRMQQRVQALLSSATLRSEVAVMQSAMGSLPFHLGARAAFEALMHRLRNVLTQAQLQGDEMQQMLDASFQQLNAGFGFGLVLAPLPDMAPHAAELDLIEQNYGRGLAFGRSWRLAAPGFAEQFRRMLLSKLRVVFESAATAWETWGQAASAQVEMQLRERRRGHARRRDTLQRVHTAAGELEQRIAEVQAQEQQLHTLQEQLEQLTRAVVSAAAQPLQDSGGPSPSAAHSTQTLPRRHAA